MYYITHDNKIMVWNSNGTDIEVINNTGYFPLCIRGTIILMCNNKLYIIMNKKMFDCYELFELATENKKIFTKQC
jgi:hypothetical protein